MVVKIILSIIIILLGLILGSTMMSTGSVALGLVVLIACFVCGILAIVTSVKQGRIKKAKKQERNTASQELNADWRGEYLHVAGLPIAENTKCALYLGNEKLTVIGAGQQFSLSLDKVADISMTTDTQIQKGYASSIGGAVAGAALLGPLGAVIGGRAKKRTTKVETHYLVITYRSDEEIQYLAFEVEDHNMLSANKICKEYQAKCPSQKSPNMVEL